MKVSATLSTLAFLALVFLIIAIALSHMGCSKHEEKRTIQATTLQEQVAVRNMYCDSLTDDSIVNRCDRGTFANLANAFCPSPPFDLSRHEWKEGEHHRDIYPNKCYPDDSKSECSPDYFITKVQDWISNENVDEFDRAMTYLSANGWRCGEGPSELTSVLHLVPLFESVGNYLGTSFSLAASEGLPAMHNYYLTASYIYAKGRMESYIGDVEKEALRQLLDKDPSSPIFLALYYRYHNGDQQKALDSMEADFPKDTPCVSGSYRGWGSAPCSIMQIWATAILEGQ